MKTSRLSLAAIAALGITTASLSASNLIDIRLPDNQWKFIGVNGGFTEADGESVDINTSLYDKSANEMMDDNASTTVYNDGSGDLVGFRVIDYTSSTEFSSAKMYVSSSGHSYNSSASHPEMYVYVDTGDGNTTPDIRIDYQIDYEGETFYLELNGSNNVYSGTFDSSATNDNPQALISYASSSSVKEGNLSIDYIFDRNITNNPGHPGIAGTKNSYTYSSNNDAIGSSDKLRIYYYDATTNSWKTYIKSSGTVVSEDFDALEKGKGYWVKFDHSNDANDSGLILGDGGILPSDYNASELAEGWNMMSFNDSSLIATGGTGLVVKLSVTGDGNYTEFTLADDEGTESIDINTTYRIAQAGDSNKTKIAEQINKQIAQAKAYGTLSKNFNVVAYPTGEDDNITLISDKKFRIKDNGSYGSIDQVTTLAGNTPYVPSLGTKANSGADINTTYVESVYGEYVLGLRVPTDTGAFTAGTILEDLGDINLSVGDNNSSAPSVSADGNMSAFAANIKANHATFETVILDTDFNDENDTILVVNDTYNFSVNDGVFVKTYKVNTSNVNGATLKIRDINGSTYETITFDDNDTATEVAKEINIDGTSTSKFDANGTTNGYLFVATGDEDYRHFYIEQTSGVDRLRLITDSTEYNASGTVREVYSLENLARADVDYYSKYATAIVIRTVSANSDEDVYIEYRLTAQNGNKFMMRFGGWNELNTNAKVSSDANYTFTSPYGKTVAVAYESNESNFSMYPSDLNSSTASQLAATWAAGINRHFSDYNTTTFTITASSSGSDLIIYTDANLSIETNASTDANISTSDTDSTALLYDSNLTIPAMVDDLKYNRVYAGSVTNNVTDPVPYLQKITGYKVRKMLTTNEDADGSSISWNFIDLTKNPDNWFEEQDAYNLFSFDKEKGYWVYLENVTDTSFNGFTAGTDSPDLTVTTTYNHSFVNDTNNSSSPYNYTTTNYISSISVQVDVGGLADTSVIDRAVAQFNGEIYKLSKSGNQYTGTIDDVTDLTGSSLDLNATLFTQDSFSATASKVIDNTPPTRPTVTVSSGDLTNVTLESSIDTVYFHTYSGDVDIAGTNLVDGNISASNGQASGYNLCSKAKSFSTNIGAYRFIAVDNANMSYGLVSDIGYLDSSDYNATIYPIYKNGSVLNATGGTSDSISVDYNSTCGNTGVASTDHAVELKAESGYDLMAAFEANTTTFAVVGASSIKTVDLKIDGTKVGQLVFDGDHYKNSGQVFLLQYNGNIYNTTFDVLKAHDGDEVNFTDTNITMLTGQTISE